MSGAGKSTVLKSLEDMGFFCVDNLPVLLIDKFVNLSNDISFENDKVALGIDIRSGEGLGKLSTVLNDMREKKFNFEIIFLDASDRSLVRRFKETRREHPLQKNGSLADGIQEERRRLEFLKNIADYKIDTTGLLVRELTRETEKIVQKGQDYNNMIITVMSFGYKFGIPQDADFVFDVRFMPNPYYEDDLRRKTGNDKEVQDYVMATKESKAFIRMLTRMTTFVANEMTSKEDRHQFVVAVGCTGGRHRSVTVANLLAEGLKDLPYTVRVFHRDIVNDLYVKGET